VELQFRVASLTMGTSARNEIIDLLHDRCKAGGLSLALPAQSLVYVPAMTGQASAPSAELNRP